MSNSRRWADFMAWWSVAYFREYKNQTELRKAVNQKIREIRDGRKKRKDTHEPEIS